VIGGLGSEWTFEGVGAVLGGKADFLLENTSGVVVAGEVGANGQAAYTQVAALGPEWKFVGMGDFLADGHTDFLIENTNGDVVAGEVVNGQTVYTRIAGLGPEWTFLGTGDFLNDGHDQFAIEDTKTGAVVLGNWAYGQNETFVQGIDYIEVGTLASGWTIHG
jgi:hypothetical protein